MEKLTNIERLNSTILKNERLKKLYVYLLDTFPGKELAYVEPFAFDIYYYFLDEKVNKEFLEEEASRIIAEINENNYFIISIFSNGIEIVVK